MGTAVIASCPQQGSQQPFRHNTSSYPRVDGWTFQVGWVLAFREACCSVLRLCMCLCIYSRLVGLPCTAAMLADRGLSQGPIFDLLH